MKKIISILMCAVLCVGFSGCENKEKTNGETAQTTPAPQKKKVKIYAGRGNDFKEYEKEIDAGDDVSAVLEELCRITGWNLNTENIETDGETVNVDFSKESSVYTGDAQTEEFLAKDSDELKRMILDSVTKTLKQNLKISEVVYTCGGESIKIGKKDISDKSYEIGANEKYTQEEAEEFLKNHLSDYYDTPTTKYAKYGETFEKGQRFYIYHAVDKNTNELLGTYKLSSDLWYLYEVSNGEDKLIWSMELYCY